MKNCYAYIRVSTVQQGRHGSSLQEQRDAIAAFALRHELAITEWFEERETAAKKGRTQFVRMMAALEKGKAAGVILHKIDRGARNLWDWARIQDLIEKGIEVHFAHDNIDLKSRGGRLAADIQAVVAADFIRNLRDEVRKGIQGRLKRGLYPLPAPIGYLNQGKGQPKTVDPISGPLVKAAFELYATKQYSYETLAKELHRRGLRRRDGEPVSLTGIQTILRNPFYAGIIRITGETYQGIHEPLIEARLYRAVQDVIASKSNTKVRRFDFTYRRLLTCGLCGYALTGELQKGHTYYRCHTRDCDTTGVRERTVTSRIDEELRAMKFSEQEIAEMRPEFERLDAISHEQRTARLKSIRLRINALEEREQRLTDAYIDQAIDREAYNIRRTALLLELSEARDELGRAEVEDGTNASRAEKFFELMQTFQLGPGSDSPSKYRAAVETLTSNRTLSGKNLDVSMPSPFKEMAGDLVLFFGLPSSGTFRTCGYKTLGREVGRRPRNKSIHVRRARIIAKHLEKWSSSGVERGERIKRRPRS
jgi:site-specific DNA recombinase